MAAVSRSDQARPAAPMTAADLEAAIAALPGRKQRLRETFNRLVARAPFDFHLPFAWDDIDAHVSSLHASFSLRFRQMQQQQQQPHPAAPVSSTATHADEQPRPGTATPEEDEQPHPGTPVSAESIQEDEEMVSEDEDASPVQEDDDVGKDREDAGMGIEGPPCCHAAEGTRDQELPVPMWVRARPDAGNPMFRQPYTAFPPIDVLSQLNLPMLQRQPPYMPYQQEFPAMAPQAMNGYNIPPMFQQPYYNIPPMVQQHPFVPYFRREFEFFPDMMMRQPPMGIDHVLRQQYMAMGHHRPYFPQQQYMVHHEHCFPVAQAASVHGQGSNAKRQANTDIINVLNARSKKSRTIDKHDAKPMPNGEPIQKKTIYDYF